LGSVLLLQSFVWIDCQIPLTMAEEPMRWLQVIAGAFGDGIEERVDAAE
jgi:hypothetical protein